MHFHAFPCISAGARQLYLAAGPLFLMEEEIRFSNPAGEKLAGFLHVPAGGFEKGICMAHCFTCSRHQRIIRKTCDLLADNGFLVLRFDFSGNGESEGRFEDATYSKEMEDLGSAVSLLASRGPKEIGVIGHSMGSAVSILHSCSDPRVKSLCVLAGQSSTASIKGIFPQDKLHEIEIYGRADVSLFGGQFTITKEFFRDAESHDIREALLRFTRPFCVIHGSSDTIIPPNSARQLYSFAPGPKEIHIIEGADHLFSKDEHLKQAQSVIASWFKKTL